MALITTVGATDADSFITLAEWQDYWDLRDVDLNQHGHDAAHEADLRIASQYITQNYNFVGQRQYQYQALAFPRLTTILVDGWPTNPDEIPQRIKSAQAELAYIIHSGVDVFATITGGGVKRSKVKAGPVEAETEYSNVRETPRFVAIEGLLAPYIAAGNSQIRMVRG